MGRLAASGLRIEDTAATQQLIARRLRDRLSILRAFARSERQATTDPLTGLLNRRSLEDRLPAFRRAAGAPGRGCG